MVPYWSIMYNLSCCLVRPSMGQWAFFVIWEVLMYRILHTIFCVINAPVRSQDYGWLTERKLSFWAFQWWFRIEHCPIIKGVMAIFVDKGHSQVHSISNTSGAVHMWAQLFPTQHMWLEVFLGMVICMLPACGDFRKYPDSCDCARHLTIKGNVEIITNSGGITNYCYVI